MSAKKISAALLGGWIIATAPVSHAATARPPSPVFTNGVAAWDCLITGEKGERGIIFFTFTTNINSFGNYTFTMQQIHTKVPVSIPRAPITVTNVPDGRGSTGNRGDTDSSVDTSTNANTAASSTVGTNIFGYWSTNGAWGLDYRGNVLGVFYERITVGSGTNAAAITNQISFIGKVTPNKRFTALFYSSIGGLGKYSGVPLKNVTNRVNGAADLSGPWTGNEIKGSLQTVELFTMANAGSPNFYTILGDGPGYTDVGLCMVSTQKKIAFANIKTPIADSLRATYGDLINSSTVLGTKTKGLIQPGSNIVYNAYFVPYVPYP